MDGCRGTRTKIGSVGGIEKGREGGKERGGGMSRPSKNGSTIHPLISL